MINRGISVLTVSLLVFCSFFIGINFGFSENVIAYSMDTSLANVDASFIGESCGNCSGDAVSIIGDVNGDSYDDFIITAPNYDELNNSVGKCYLIFGKATGWNMSSDLASSDVYFYGENPGDYTGWTVSGAGDVNNDGYDDILIGAMRFSNYIGKTYLIFGKAAGWTKNYYLANADASFIGESEYDHSGRSISGEGDINGDGFHDFVIGTPSKDGIYADGGKAYIIFGKSTGWTKNLTLSNSDASFVGTEKFEYLGREVKIAGDVNNDGFDDLLIGAIGNDDGGNDAGKVHLIFGKSSGWSNNQNITSSDVYFIGESSGDYAGQALSSGDVNGDGYNDIFVSSNDKGGNNGGKTYLIFGKATGWSKINDLSDADCYFTGENSNDDSGSSLSCSGDINGDGYSDIIIGARYNSEIGTGCGQTYVILGKPLGWNQYNDLTNSDASFIGENAYHNSGYSISSSGDVNGDGFDDILISSPWAHKLPGNYFLGETYLIFFDDNYKPLSVYSVTFYSDSDCTVHLTSAKYNETIYIELVGQDGDPSSANVAKVQINSSKTDTNGIGLNLYETGDNTGKYRSNFKIADHTSQSNSLIGASGGETVQVTSTQNISIFDTLSVEISGLTILPSGEYSWATEDQFYFQTYYVEGEQSVVYWDIYTSAYWLHWGETNHTLYGTPTNADVGSYFVEISAYDTYSHSSRNISLTVYNSPPEIITEDQNIAYCGYDYYADYDSTDDHQGYIYWSFSSDADWLSFNTTTGELSGKPTYDDAGTYSVYIVVDDGNAGYDWQNFTITVYESDSLRIVPVQDKQIAYTGQLYEQTYTCIGVDEGTIVIWKFGTDALWLRFGTDNHTLYGTPTIDDIGLFWVTINISDGKNNYDQHTFNITVYKGNNQPQIIGAPSKLVIPPNQNYTLDIEPYLSDQDNETYELKLFEDSEYAHVYGLKIIFNYPTNISSETVTIWVKDWQSQSNSHEIYITISSENITSPRIIDYYPIGVNVPVNTEIRIYFNSPMNISSVIDSFSITPTVEGKFSGNNTYLIFTPNENLKSKTKYRILVTSDAFSLNNFQLDKDYIWNFTTTEYTIDKDEDGYPDEIDAFPDNPLYYGDTDGDNMADKWEEQYGLDKTNPLDASLDIDNDGRINLQEFVDGTDPRVKELQTDDLEERDDTILYIALILIIILIFFIVILLIKFQVIKFPQKEVKSEKRKEVRVTKDEIALKEFKGPKKVKRLKKKEYK